MRRSNLLFIAFRFRLFCFQPRQSSFFCQSAVSRETISKMATDFPAQCVIAILPSRCFPLFGTPYSLAGLFQNGRRTMTRRSLIYTFRVFLLSNLFHVKHSIKTPSNGAGWTFFCILSAFHAKHSLKTAPGDMPFDAWKRFRAKKYQKPIVIARLR